MYGDLKKLLAAAGFTALLIVLVNVAWWIFYDRAEQMLDQQLSRRLTTAASTAAALFDPGLVEGLVAGDFESYARAATIVEDIRRGASLAEVFVLDPNYRYLITTSLDEDTTYFLAALNGPYINTLFFSVSHDAIATPSYRSGDIYLKSAFAPLYDSSGFVAAVVGVEADVDYFASLTDLRHNLYYATGLSLLGGLVLGLIFLLVLRRLNRVQQQLFLNQTESYLGRMVAVVSHEVKNPLMIIRGSAERLHKKDPAPESRFILEEVDRLNEIVTGYLDFSAGRAGLTSREAPEPIEPGELIGSLRKHLHQKYPSEEIGWIDNDIPSGLAFTGYRRSLRQVLLNLLINGADACRESGKPIEIGVAVRSRGDQVELVVIDHGPGFPAAVRRRLFEPFFTTRQNGTGLGLYLSKKIVEEMGGEMLIESEAGKPTEVVLRIPTQPRK